jgi:Fe-S-cluster-containing hydrogenase component 2
MNFLFVERCNKYTVVKNFTNLNKIEKVTCIGCSQCFLIPATCPFPTTATTDECSLATFNNFEDIYLKTQV